MSEKWCRFQAGGKVLFGRIDGDSVTAIDGEPWGAHTVTSNKHALSSVKLLIPTVPSTFYCVGINYREHIIQAAKRRGVEPQFPQRPDIGYRANNALCAHEDPIIKPKDAGDIFQYEGELVAVFGKAGKQLGDFSTVHEIDCRNENDLLVSEITAWRVQKLTLHPQPNQTSGPAKSSAKSCMVPRDQFAAEPQSVVVVTGLPPGIDMEVASCPLP